MTEPAETVTVHVVGYREVDSGPAEQRVDLEDPVRRMTLASLTPEYALVLANELRAQALLAQRMPEA